MNEQKKDLAYKSYSILETPERAKEIVENLSNEDLDRIEERTHRLFLGLAKELGYGYCDTCKKIDPEECDEVMWERMEQMEEAYD